MRKTRPLGSSHEVLVMGSSKTRCFESKEPRFLTKNRRGKVPRILFVHPPTKRPSFPGIREKRRKMSIRRKGSSSVIPRSVILGDRTKRFPRLRNSKMKEGGSEKIKSVKRNVSYDDRVVYSSPIICCIDSRICVPLYRFCPQCGNVVKNGRKKKINYCSKCFCYFCFSCLRVNDWCCRIYTCKNPKPKQKVKPIVPFFETKTPCRIEYNDLKDPNEMSLSNRLSNHRIRYLQRNIEESTCGISPSFKKLQRRNIIRNSGKRYSPNNYELEINPIVGSTMNSTNFLDFNSPKQIVTRTSTSPGQSRLPKRRKGKNNRIRRSFKFSFDESKRERVAEPYLSIFKDMMKKKKEEEMRRKRAVLTYKNRSTTPSKYFRCSFKMANIGGDSLGDRKDQRLEF